MNEPRSLRDLVEVAVGHHDASGRQLAFLAQKQGYRITFTTINQIRQGTYKFTPSAETIRAIGWLAGVNDEVAFTAAGQPVPGPPFADELPPGVDLLPPKARKAAIEMLRVLVDLNKDAQHDAEDTNTTEAIDSDEAGKSHPTSATQPSDELEQQRAARRRPRKEQKTKPPVPSGEELFGDDYDPADPVQASTLMDLRGQQDNGAVPENWQELAAYKGPTSHLDRERYFDELGEDSQHTRDDD